MGVGALTDKLPHQLSGGEQQRAGIGLSSETHHESILIDRVGRMQLPKDMIERLPFHGRADVRFMSDHVEVWPRDMQPKD